MSKAAINRLTVVLLMTGASALPALAASVQVQYSYDPIGRLTASTYSTGQTLAYSYDPAGNLTHVAHNASSAAALLELTTSGPGTVQRNPAGSPENVGGATVLVEYGTGTNVTLTAQPQSGATFLGWSGACGGSLLSCQLDMNTARSVVAAFAAQGSGGGSGAGGGIVMSGLGGTTVAGNTPDAQGVPGAGGEITATVSGGGNGSWVFTEAEVLATPPAGSAPPAGVSFPYGLIDFELALGEAGSTATVVLTYAEPLPAGTRYYKYGRTQGGPSPHWYVFNGAVVNGNTITLTLTDGGAGDDDLLANGVIVDPGGPGVPAGGVTAIPTLSQWALLALVGLLGLAAFGSLRGGRKGDFRY